MTSPFVHLPLFLIASPKLEGTPFEHAVILLVSWSEESAMGFIINMPLPSHLVAPGSRLHESATSDLETAPLPTHFGGPVKSDGVWLLDTRYERRRIRPEEHSDVLDKDLISFADDYEEPSDPVESGDLQRTFIGYSAWDEDQLNREFNEGSWLILEFQDDIFLASDLPKDAKDESLQAVRDSIWEMCLARLQLDGMSFTFLPTTDHLQ